jgi:geranylgeranyl diphosphate synthase type I
MTELIPSLLPAIETELQRQIARLDEARYRPFHEMLTYHMGWSGEGAGLEATGKRIRPLLVLLASASCGADTCTEPQVRCWQSALPAAAAVELVHNFSLVHDDIQDNSDKRRGRATVWKKWGTPLAINVGDALFVIANQAVLDLADQHPADRVVQAARILHQTCLDLTKGQYLDMSYADRGDVALEDYWPMIGGKTSSLISACCHLGALLGGADEAAQDAYRSFGNYLGLAFQVQDDILGIWGDEARTGKSAASDLVEGKKSLPVLYGLSLKGKFAARWMKGSITPEEVPALAEQLDTEGAHMYAQETADRMTDLALASLRSADPQGEAGVALLELANKLLQREN